MSWLIHENVLSWKVVVREHNLVNVCIRLIESATFCWDFKLMHHLYCKSLYFRVFFISRFSDHQLIHWDWNLRCTTISYVNCFARMLNSWAIKFVNISKNWVLANNREFTVTTTWGIAGILTFLYGKLGYMPSTEGTFFMLKALPKALLKSRQLNVELLLAI